VVVAALAFAGCAEYASIKSKRPQLPGPAGSGELVAAERAIVHAQRTRDSKPLQALGDLLDAMHTASAELRRNPGNEIARRDYNFALSRAFAVIKEGKIDIWSKPLTVACPSGDFVISHARDPRPEWNPARYDFTPADQFSLGGLYVSQRSTREGIGAPIVAVEREPDKVKRPLFAPSRLFYCVTVVGQFEGRRCVLSGYDPLAKETVTFNGRSVPLAADFTVPLAIMLRETEKDRHEIMRVFNPEKYAHTAVIERLQPYDPNKAIVLVIHGLLDSQATWTPMINTLRSDPFIRQHYQFWFYSYPSGYPYPYSAAILRHKLDELEAAYPSRKPMVVIGHSMGGCISRLLVTDSGDELSKKIFGKPLEEVPLSPRAREYFREELFFRHRPEIGRVIFIASPLRGSDLATGWLARIAASFIKPVKLAAEASREMLQIANHSAANELKLKRRATGVDTLSPDSRFVNAINTIPITPGVPYNTIIGDRGRGDSPKSSDGVVPYWSSHMDGAQSEHIVPSNHSAHQNPQAITTVLNILKAHAPR
jgi:pimeloyl-ACP methyl ester carboxylesterase